MGQLRKPPGAGRQRERARSARVVGDGGFLAWLYHPTCVTSDKLLNLSEPVSPSVKSRAANRPPLSWDWAEIIIAEEIMHAESFSAGSDTDRALKK